MVWFLITAALLVLDQVSKAVITNVLTGNGSVVVIDRFFFLIHRMNAGGAWSLFQEYSWGIYLLSGISALASGVMIYLIITWKNRAVRACLSVILAGSLGNLVDRVLFGGVTDFLSFHFGSYVFPTFNVADMCIVCGTIVLFLLLLLHPDWLALGSGKDSAAGPK